jgi:hypothetical protein|tara:strand:- start:2587 stop:3516 length:930 start_codon:yes stop_codon:yes gene_type:complete
MESPKKKRCYYIPENDNIFCHNCGWSSKPFKWIKEVSNCSNSDIIEEIKDYEVTIDITKDGEVVTKIQTETLPKDSINLSDPLQRAYYSQDKMFNLANEVIHNRRLDTAVNRPDNLYLSLSDMVHKNRLVIPFVNEKEEIEFYQTRTLRPQDNRTKPKYLGKVGSEKTLFNINKVSSDHDKVYIFEGPIDAFFVRNSVAVAGITERGKSFTKRQEEQMNTTLRWYDKVWILDSQWGDRASMIKSEALLKQGETVFIWPETLGKKYKDFNDLARAANKNEIGWDWIEKNTFRELEGIIKMTQIKKYFNGK